MFKYVNTIYRYEQYFFVVILILFWFVGNFVSAVSEPVINFVVWLTGLPFGF